ncbi:hypothetical protein [Flavihumibacter sp. CACIAM 22H1]|uniref:hypothetical protein n=1 Tax=Flavihumibacter sp. CACIAM 22H1 TaxID=1812911 RepID=UPI0007A7D4F7|nr:hypothetical protein [Flavihumibacter sp. CACIAM 22H1]KYP14229.1 MAG: hypothetical protein A1D16_11795 [Flavihumibacter sp. CACIAM 22H1]
MSEVLKISSTATAAVIYPTPVTDKLPLNLKGLVQELFEQDKLAGSLDKEIKQVKARYHQLILRKSDKTYTDSEILAIKKVHDELTELQTRKAAFQVRKTEIKAFLTTLIAPLGGGRWIHETDDFMNPHWEFWLEDEELKYARLKSDL